MCKLPLSSSPSVIMTHPFVKNKFTWNLNLLLLQSFNSKHSSIGRVSIIGSTPTIQFSILYHGFSGSKTFKPSFEWRLLVKMSIKEQSNRQISLDFCKNDWRVSFIMLDFSSKPFNIETLDPILDMVCSLQEASILIPLWIVCPGEVGDFDVFH